MTHHIGFLDALRGVAILMVILAHSCVALPGLNAPLSMIAGYGQMGVQLFFVVSGFTLCLTFDRRQHERMPIPSFYIRRFFRIAPMYYLAIMVHFGLSIIDQMIANRGSGFSYPLSPIDLLAHLSFLHGFIPSSMNKAVPGGWSIGTEMAFYMIFPWLFRAMAWLCTKDLRYGWIMIGAAFFINLAVDLVAACGFDYWIINNRFLYFWILNQLPVFLLGMLGYFDLKRQIHPVATSPFQMGGVAVYTGASLVLWSWNPPFAFTLIPLVSGYSFYLLAKVLRGLQYREGVLARVGKVSFSIYILHFLVIRFLWTPLADALRPVVAEELLLLFGFVLTAAISFALARHTEALIEARGIRLGRGVVDWLHRRYATQ